MLDWTALDMYQNTDIQLTRGLHGQRYFYCISPRKHNLTLQVPITAEVNDSLNIFSLFFSERIRHDISCESSARQRIHMKHHALFSSKDKKEKNHSVNRCIRVNVEVLYLW